MRVSSRFTISSGFAGLRAIENQPASSNQEANRQVTFWNHSPAMCVALEAGSFLVSRRPGRSIQRFNGISLSGGSGFDDRQALVVKVLSRVYKTPRFRPPGHAEFYECSRTVVPEDAIRLRASVMIPVQTFARECRIRQNRDLVRKRSKLLKRPVELVRAQFFRHGSHMGSLLKQCCGLGVEINTMRGGLTC
jgi:hypothetical protein